MDRQDPGPFHLALTSHCRNLCFVLFFVFFPSVFWARPKQIIHGYSYLYLLRPCVQRRPEGITGDRNTQGTLTQTVFEDFLFEVIWTLVREIWDVGRTIVNEMFVEESNGKMFRIRSSLCSIRMCTFITIILLSKLTTVAILSTSWQTRSIESRDNPKYRIIVAEIFRSSR